MGADHLVGTAAHHHGEADVLIAQPDIAHIASADIDEAPHHITLTPLQSQSPAQIQTVTEKIYQYYLKNAKIDAQHLYQQNSLHFPAIVTQKIQTQHAMNYQFQTHHQKHSQTQGTEYYQRT